METKETVKQIVSLKQIVAEREELTFSKVTSSYGLATVMMEEIGTLTQEHLVVICLNTKNEVTYISTVFVGSVNQSIAQPRDILQRALLSNAARIAICHNHPSNSPTPSENDKLFTYRLQECCEIMGIDFLDHIIVGRDCYMSFREESLL